ncbi:MAG TPA: hypothetical protein VNJ01_01940 [Bacteriovoracaceae bacterium]|nr:hypothetical protein [Bacteriovoracaceae bacterium]
MKYVAPVSLLMLFSLNLFAQAPIPKSDLIRIDKLLELEDCERVDPRTISCPDGEYKKTSSVIDASRVPGKETKQPLPADTRSIEEQGNPQ